MIDINFEEPDTFKTPDGKEWIVNPIRRPDLKKLNKFVELNDEVDKLRKKGKINEANCLLYGVDESNENEETLLSIADEIINLSIEEVQSKEKLPEKYYRQITKAIELCIIIVRASTGKMDAINKIGQDKKRKKQSS